MSKRTVNLADFAKELGVHNDKQLEQLHQASLLGIAKAIPLLVETSPVDTGLYAQSWDFRKEEFGAVLGNTAPYASIIEYGARPFTPPIEPLLAWAKRVLGDSSQPPDYSPQVKALAFAVQQKIKREGMKPRHVMENAIPQIIENIKAEYMRMNG